jgi:hypothetical protein
MLTVLHGSKSTLHHCALRLGPCLDSRVPTPSPRTSLSKTPPAAADAAIPAMDGYAPVPGSYTDKAIGCILAALCGDALGAYAEGWTAHRIQEEFENGLTEFKHCRMGLGFYTGEFAQQIRMPSNQPGLHQLHSQTLSCTQCPRFPAARVISLPHATSELAYTQPDPVHCTPTCTPSNNALPGILTCCTVLYCIAAHCR